MEFALYILCFVFVTIAAIWFSVPKNVRNATKNENIPEAPYKLEPPVEQERPTLQEPALMAEQAKQIKNAVVSGDTSALSTGEVKE